MMKMFLNAQKKQKEESEILRLQQIKAQLQSDVDNLVSRKKTMEQSIAKSLSDIQSRYQSVQQAYENFRLVESGFGALEEIGYDRYVPTMESDDIEK